MPIVEAPAPRVVRDLWLHTDSCGTTDLIHSFRVLSGKKGFPQKSSRRFLEVRSNVKRMTFGTGEIHY